MHDDSWSFDKSLNMIEKLIFTLLYKYMIFPLFWLILSSFFCLNHMKSFLSTVNNDISNDNNNNQCQKFPRKTFFSGFQLIIFENKRSFMKKAILYTTTLIHCKARPVLRNLFSTKQKMAPKWHLCEELLKSTSKFNASNNLKALII